MIFYHTRAKSSAPTQHWKSGSTLSHTRKKIGKIPWMLLAYVTKFGDLNHSCLWKYFPGRQRAWVFICACAVVTASPAESALWLVSSHVFSHATNRPKRKGNTTWTEAEKSVQASFMELRFLLWFLISTDIFFGKLELRDFQSRTEKWREKRLIDRRNWVRVFSGVKNQRFGNCF